MAYPRSSSPKSAPGEPEPIEAEFEANADVATEAEAKARQKEPRRRARRSRSVTPAELMLASTAAAVLGAVAAIVVTGANSSSPTGTLAQEIDTLKDVQTSLTARTDQAGADIAMIRSRLDAHDEALAQRLAGEKKAATEAAALTAQLSALIGVGDGQPVPGAVANASPLGALLGRITRLETIVREDADAPATTRQVQRTLGQLAGQVAALDQASRQLAAADNRRQAAMAALESGLARAGGDIDALRAASAVTPAAGNASAAAKAAAPTAANAAAAPAAGPVSVSAAVSTARALRALTALSAAAQSGGPFVNRHRALAAALPGDRDVLALANISRRGAPSLAALRRSFAAAARRADLMAAADADDGWNWLRAAVSGVVPVDRPGLDAAAATAVAAARRAVDIGDPRAAVDALDSLPPDLLPAFASWRLAALRRAELDERLDLLTARLAAS
jgi:hypothetical protein